MKKILTMAAAALLALSFTACDDKLDVTNYTSPNTGNFPATTGDVNKELNGAYSTLNAMCQDPLQMPYFVWDIMSDEQNGGGGTGDVESHAIGHLTSNKATLFDHAWAALYQGVARTSTVIYGIDNFEWADQSQRNQLLGEALFLRAQYYLWASQMFGDVPAYWEASRPTPCPQVSAQDVIYPHIFADLVSASELMSKKVQGDGHATKYAAEALLARAYLFYQGFYKKQGEMATANPEAVELPADTYKGATAKTSLSKQDVIDALNDVIQKGGYKLVGDFRDLWQYTNKLTVDDYDYTKGVKGVDGQPLMWAGNGNSEEIFQIQFMNAASWNGTTGMGYCNQMELYAALRCDADAQKRQNGGPETFPFGQGWGQGTVTVSTWDNWPNSDIRKKASILNAPEELKGFVFTTSCSEDAGFYNKKMQPITALKGYDGTAATGTDWDNHSNRYTWWACLQDAYVNNNGNSMQGDHFGDLMLIRYADVLLMQTELTGDAQYMNKVRARAGLDPITYTWANLKAERQHELAFEGLRFNDLRRWSGINGGENCEAAQALEKAKEGQRVNYTGNWATMRHATSSWSKRYAETDGFLAIPSAEIEKVNDKTILKQNPGWGANVPEANITGSPVYQ